MNSNVSMQSNIQPIKVFAPTARTRYDVEFLAKIHDYKALNKLRFMLSSSGSMNTNDYNYKYHQFSIVNNTGYGGYKNRDQCWGPVKRSNGRIELVHSPLVTDEEIRYFDPSDESSVESYGYATFLSENFANPLIINTDLATDEDYEVGLISTADSLKDKKIDLLSLAKKTQATPTEVCVTVKPLIETINENVEFLSLDENIFEYFIESSQENIITANVNDVIFVDAGPGTGKTYTLIQRINNLVTEQGVDPESILVLCFTNAAVDEIKGRLYQFVKDGADRGLSNVDVRTFHSFAWWLISQANELFVKDGWFRVNMNELTYESSLKTATNIIKRFSEYIVGNWEHFIVDEVQDLTNTLAHFVLYIIRACLTRECGFTVLGDACQAIYDYAQDGSMLSMKSEDFYRALANQIHKKAKFLKLTKNYRQNQTLISATHQLREGILSLEHKRMEAATSKMLDALPKISKTSVSIQEEELKKIAAGGRVCLLLRNNGQTLRVSSNLRKRGIKHILNCSTNDRNFAGWIADVFYDYPKKYMDFETFEERIRGNEILNLHSADDIWIKMTKITHSDDEICVREVLDAILFSKIDDVIFRNHAEGNIIVSNIHRSKGREYESVILDQDFIEDMTEENSAQDEYKTLYVGVTRPKNHLYIAPLQKRGELQYIHIFDTDRHRWGKTKKGQLTYLEFDSSTDLSRYDFVNINPSTFSDVKIDDEVILQRFFEI